MFKIKFDDVSFLQNMNYIFDETTNDKSFLGIFKLSFEGRIMKYLLRIEMKTGARNETKFLIKFNEKKHKLSIENKKFLTEYIKLHFLENLILESLYLQSNNIKK